MRENGKASIDCRRCIHYYVTWDKHFPMGCRLYGFKSRRPPCITVAEAIGQPCTGFQRKLVRKK